MWIRSQDKEALTNGDIIYYCDKSGMIRCGKVGISDDYDLVLAAYSTKEKALKVLDEIQRLIYDYQIGGVFQMPQDDEVDDEVEE
jgi:aminoglycoside phosphotransferase